MMSGYSHNVSGFFSEIDKNRALLHDRKKIAYKREILTHSSLDKQNCILEMRIGWWNMHDAVLLSATTSVLHIYVNNEEKAIAIQMI